MPFGRAGAAGDGAEPGWGYLVVCPPGDPLPQQMARMSPVVAMEAWSSDSKQPVPPSSLNDEEIGIAPGAAGEGRSPVWIRGKLIEAAFAALARVEERSVRERDAHDRFQWAHTLARPPEKAVKPLVSDFASLLSRAVAAAFRGACLGQVRKECWPGGKGMAAALSHDVDVVKRGKLPLGIAVRDVRGALAAASRGRISSAAEKTAAILRTATAGRDPYWTFDRISEMEKGHGYRSTYFFMAGRRHPQDAGYDPADARIRRLMATLEADGCEVGLHGSYATFEDGDALLDQKKHLEDCLGHEVHGHRNHLLRFRAPESWRAHQRAGFAYDATLGYADHEGFRGGHAFPFRPYDIDREQPFGFTELPLAVMDVGISKYRKLRGAEAEKAVALVLEQARAVNGLSVLLWHNDTFYAPDYPGSAGLYGFSLDWLSGAGAHVATLGEIDGWWRARESVELRPLAGGRHGWRMAVPADCHGLVLRLSLPPASTTVETRGSEKGAMGRDGEDFLLEFRSLAAGSTVDIEYR